MLPQFLKGFFLRFRRKRDKTLTSVLAGAEAFMADLRTVAQDRLNHSRTLAQEAESHSVMADELKGASERAVAEYVKAQNIEHNVRTLLGGQ